MVGLVSRGLWRILLPIRTYGPGVYRGRFFRPYVLRCFSSNTSSLRVSKGPSISDRW